MPMGHFASWGTESRGDFPAPSRPLPGLPGFEWASYAGGFAGRPGGAGHRVRLRTSASEPFALQRLAIDAQDPGGLALVASRQLQDAADVPPLQRGQVEIGR